MDRSKQGCADELMELQGRLARRFFFDSKLDVENDLPLARQEVRVLLSIGASDNVRMGDLAERLGVSLSSLTAIVGRMVDKGLLARQNDADDRRVVRVSLTPTGREQHEIRRRARRHMAEGMLNALDPEEQRTFLALMRKIVSHTAVLLLFAGLAAGSIGCATVRQARETQRGTHPLPGEQTLSAAASGLTAGTVLTLDEAIRLALTNSAAVLEARAAVETSETQLRQARADYFPSINASAGYTRAKDYGPVGGPATDHYGTGLSLSEDFFSFGRTAAAVHEARAKRDAALARLHAAEATAVFAVRADYCDLFRAQELLAVDEESVRQFQSHLDQVRAMAELGTRIRYDVTKAEVDLGTARLTALVARNTWLAARAALGRDLGLAEDLPAAIAAPPTDRLPVEGREAIVARARARNPDLSALRHLVDAASAAIDAAIADLRPDLSFGASYSWGGGDWPLGRGWSLGPSLGWSLFNGWRRTAAVEAAAAGLRSARASVADREQLLYQTIVTALAQLDTARQRLELARLLVQQARENLNLVSERYKLGLATSVELTDAEVAVVQTRSQQVQAQYDAWVAIATVRRNTGD